MTENDINSNNINLLINGICQFGCIYVDKIYKMKLQILPTTSLKNNLYSLQTNSCELIGVNSEAGFDFEWGENFTPDTVYYLFNFNNLQDKAIQNLTLKNLKFTASYNSLSPKVIDISSKGLYEFFSEALLEEFMKCNYNNSTIQNYSKQYVAGTNTTYHDAACAQALKYVGESAGVTKPDTIADFSNSEYESGAGKRYKLRYFQKLFDDSKQDPQYCRLILFNRDEKQSGCISQDFQINKLSIVNCSFFGNIRLFEIARNQDNVFHICDGRINNNTFENNRTACISISNALADYIEVKNNIIKNFDNLFFSWTVGDIAKTNTVQGISAVDLAKDIKKIIIENNTCINDDDWYHNQYANISYYCFVQCECNKIIYRNNKVVGMKSFQPYRIQPDSSGSYLIRLNLALYDAYLSCIDVTYENNYWENNVLFFYYGNNTLLKAKDSQLRSVNGNTPAPGLRKYHNNIFISTQDYLKKHLTYYWKDIQKVSEDMSNEEFDQFLEEKLTIPYVSFISNTCVNNWDIQNNTFNIYNLTGMSGTGSAANNKLKTVLCGYKDEEPRAYRFKSYTQEEAENESVQTNYTISLKIANLDKTINNVVVNKQIVDSDGNKKALNNLKNLEPKNETDTNNVLVNCDGWTEDNPEGTNLLDLNNNSYNVNNDTITITLNLLPQDDNHYFIRILDENNDHISLEGSAVEVVVSGDDITQHGYYLKNLILKNNYFNIEHLKASLIGGQRNDSVLICENNNFNVAPDLTSFSSRKPVFFQSTLTTESVGKLIINNNIFKGFSTILLSPNIIECHLNNNYIEADSYEAKTRTGGSTIVSPHFIEYSYTDLNDYLIEDINESLQGINYKALQHLYGCNNKINNPITTFLPEKESVFDFTIVTNPDNTIIKRYKWKTKNDDPSAEELYIATGNLKPQCYISCEGVSKLSQEENAGILSPFPFAGTVAFDGQMHNYGENYYVDQIMEYPKTIAEGLDLDRASEIKIVKQQITVDDEIQYNENDKKLYTKFIISTFLEEEGEE